MCEELIQKNEFAHVSVKVDHSPNGDRRKKSVKFGT